VIIRKRQKLRTFVNTCIDGAHASSQVKIATVAILIAAGVGLAIKVVEEHKT
jgi:hypothetical protein